MPLPEVAEAGLFHGERLALAVEVDVHDFPDEQDVVAHGVLILGYSSAASTRILEEFERPMVSVGYDRVRFLKPVRLGDTLSVDYEISSVDEKRERITSKIEISNQRGEVVLVADHIMQLVD